MDKWDFKKEEQKESGITVSNCIEYAHWHMYLLAETEKKKRKKREIKNQGKSCASINDSDDNNDNEDASKESDNVDNEDDNDNNELGDQNKINENWLGDIDYTRLS